MTVVLAGLVVDHKDDRLYWVNTESNTIMYYDFVLLMGREVSLPEGTSPTAAVVYNNTLYYADHNEGAIHAVDKSDGSDHRVVRNNTGTFGLYVITYVKQSKFAKG
jgi:sugar lactone lactonase YvrE